MSQQKTNPAGIIGRASPHSLARSIGGQTHHCRMYPHSRRKQKEPISTAGYNFTQLNRYRIRFPLQFKCCQRIPRQPQILGQHVPGTERNNSDPGIGAGHALQNVKYGAVSAANKNGIEAALYGTTRPLACRAVKHYILYLYNAAFITQQRSTLLYDRAPATLRHQQRIHKEDHFSHISQFETTRDRPAARTRLRALITGGPP